MTEERELIKAVEELLKGARFLTLDPFAAYMRLRETTDWQYFKETYDRVAALIEESESGK
jgi:hypothetical protein